MDLSVASRRHKADAVTLLSYANSSTGTKTVSNNNNNYVHRFASNCVTQSGSNCYSVAQAPPCVIKKSEKFLRTFRRRSKSASRLREVNDSPNRGGLNSDDRNRNFSGSALTLNDESELEQEPESSITYVANGERARNPDKCIKPDKVTLIGFATKSSSNLLSLTGDCSIDGDFRQTTGKASSNGFSTLKTSREVKMERERLRQERLQKLTQETKDWFDKVRQESKESSLMTAHQKIFNAATAEERARFFDEARETFRSKIQTGRNDEIFGQFVRENQERFSQLLQQQQQQIQSNAFARPQLSSTVGHPPANVEAKDNSESSCSSFSSLNNSAAAAATASTSSPQTTTTSPSIATSSSASAKPQYRHRALSRDAARDIFDPIRESNPAPSAAEVVASLLSERGYQTRIPLKQRLVTNHLISRANNLNNNLNNNNGCNKTILKKDLIESNAARIHTIKIQREVSTEETPSSSDVQANGRNDTCEDDDLEKERKKEVGRKTNGEKLHRTGSGSSGLSTSSSSGFSSLGGDKSRDQSYKTFFADVPVSIPARILTRIFKYWWSLSWLFKQILPVANLT